MLCRCSITKEENEVADSTIVFSGDRKYSQIQSNFFFCPLGYCFLIKQFTHFLYLQVKLNCNECITAGIPLLTIADLKTKKQKRVQIFSFVITNYPPLTQKSTTESRTCELLCTYPILSQYMSVAVVFQKVQQLSVMYADKFLLLIAKNNLPQQSNAWKTVQSCKWLQSVEMRDQGSLLIYKSSDKFWFSLVTLATILKLAHGRDTTVVQSHTSQDSPCCLE